MIKVLTCLSSFQRLAAFAVALLGLGLAQASPQEAIVIGSKKQLFIDDHLIASMTGVLPIVNQPLKYAANPVIEMDRCWEAGLLFANSSNVLYDENDGLYKMWNQVVNYQWNEHFLAYYTSKDGLSWDKPFVADFDYHSPNCRGVPGRNHNFVLGRPVGTRTPGVFKDPTETDPNKRFKMLYQPVRQGSPIRVWAAHSPDGIHWMDYPSGVNPVLLGNDTHQIVFWDPFRSKYVAHIRLWPPIYKTDARFEAGGMQGRVRVPAIATSSDFVHWDAPQKMTSPVDVNRRFILLPPDERDAPCTGGFYTLAALPYEGIYLGFYTYYHVCPGMEPKLPPTGGNTRNPWLDTIDVHLVVSRDGLTWRRVGDGRPFIPNGPEGSYDSGMIFVSQQPIVRHDLDEIWIYYKAFKSKHNAEKRGEPQESSIALATIRLDGFISIAAGEGHVETKPLVFEGDRLRINALTAGQSGFVAAELLDPGNGQPFPGYSKDDCDPFWGDSIRHTLTWKGQADVNRLAGRSVQIRFHLERAKLFSFQFYHTNDSGPSGRGGNFTDIEPGLEISHAR